MKETAYLSLGSNLGQRQSILQDAMTALEQLGKITARSSLYETEPVEVGTQPWFLNCAVALETELPPAQLLSAILALEEKMGRRRTGVKAPRTLDIDIVLYGNRVVDTPGLTIPHPAMQHRRFVLKPLAEIAADARHPVLDKTVGQLLQALRENSGAVRKLEESTI